MTSINFLKVKKMKKGQLKITLKKKGEKTGSKI
jgi:hypothetical protein